MDDWDGFYTLAGSTAGTLIGLIFVVITLGIDHTKKGDEHRVRLFVTPVLVYFASLLVIAMVMVPPLSSAWRAFALGAIGSAGLAYVMNLWMLSHRVMRFEGPRIIWHVAVPLASFTLITASAAAFALEAPFANALCALGVVILLVTSVRNTWMVTLGIASRPCKAKRRGPREGVAPLKLCAGARVRVTPALRRGALPYAFARAPCPAPASMPASFSDT
jgi:hypothetical protein